MAARQVLVPPADPASVKDPPVPEGRIAAGTNGVRPLHKDPKAWRAFLRTLSHYDPN